MAINSKKISYKLPLGSIIFVLVIIIGFLTMHEPHKKYHLKTDQALNEIIKHKGTVDPMKIADILYKGNDLYQFIDLRTPHEFIKGHMPGAINIPLHQIFDDEYEPIFNQDTKINILYHDDHLTTCGPWMMLKQLGYKNNKIMLGGYTFVKTHIIDEFSPQSGDYKDEKAKYDYAKVVSTTSGAASSGSEQKVSKKKLPAFKKKAVEEESGGC